MGRVEWWKRQGVEVSWKSKVFKRETKVREFAGFLQSVHYFINAKKKEGLAGGVSLDEGCEGQMREDGRREDVSKDLRDRKIGAKVKVS
jgi:hypothetical protein